MANKDARKYESWTDVPASYQHPDEDDPEDLQSDTPDQV